MHPYRWCRYSQCCRTPHFYTENSLSLSLSPAESLSMEKMVDEEYECLLPKPVDWLTRLVIFNVDIIYNCLFSLFIAPILSLISLVTDSYHRAEHAKESVESAVQSTITHGTTLLLKKLGFGFLGAAYVCMVLIMVMVFAALVGVGLVQVWVEEPVFVRERLHFDYTDAHPYAVFSFSNIGGVGKSKRMGVPVGHTFYVSLVLLMPESDYNREIGVFQLSAEILSSHGIVITKSSQPCMLRFRSLPIRLTRTVMMGVPLLLGISAETQTISVDILKHKEVHSPRTEAIRVTLIPRAGTSSLPQLYEAEIIMNSQLPWRKEIVHNWKWTFYVWVTLYVYILLILSLVCCFRPLIFPMGTLMSLSERRSERDQLAAAQEPKVAQARVRDHDREVSEAFKKWQRNRTKRKAMFMQGVFPESAGVGSSASSISITRDDTSLATEEDTGDSESVCLGG